MKILKTALLSLFLLAIVPSVTFAKEIVREQNGTKCLDLEAMYAEVNNSSKALTGQENSIDAVKKAQTVATLTNIMSVLIGDRIYCVNDEVAAAKTNSLKDIGILGQITKANTQMIAYFPAGEVTEHLAQEFIPGYDGSYSVLAQQNTGGSGILPDIQRHFENAMKGIANFMGGLLFEDFDIEDLSKDKIVEDFEAGLEDTVKKGVDGMTGVVTEIEKELEVSLIDEGDDMTQSGYTYLKESLHLDTVWGFFRNVAYVFFVIIMVIAGFMIMFRHKLGGQTLVTLGNALPQVILGIILVTFSFAIVGLVMDAGKTSMGIISSEFASMYDKDDAVEKPDKDIVAIDSVNKLANQAMQNVKKEGILVKQIRKLPMIGAPIADAMTGLGNTVVGTVLEAYLMYGLNRAIGHIKESDIDMDSDVYLVDLLLDPFVWLVKAGVDVAVFEIGQMLILPFLIRNIILLLVTLYASFKLFLTMITTYFKLFLNVVFGPIQIALGSLPGNFSMIAKWFKSVLANVLVFVGIHLVIHLFAYLSIAIDPRQFNFFGNKGLFWPNWIISLDGIILIGGYLFAASLPQVINGMLKVEQSREMAAAGQSVKQAAGKIPLIGGMFGS
jgi:hypothetical protein